MTNSFVRRLESHVRLSAPHQRALEDLTAPTIQLGAHESIIREGDATRAVNVVMSGWACRYKVLPDGRRQIASLFLPGDMCDPYVFLLGAMDQTLSTLTPVTLARLPASAIREMTASGPELAEALWWHTLVDIEIQHERNVSLGRRDALERLAHLMCEVVERLTAVGLSDGAECEWPLTQIDTADVLGLSTVHVSRSLGELRARHLIDLRGRRLTIHDRRGLTELAMFDPAYLHHRAR